MAPWIVNKFNVHSLVAIFRMLLLGGLLIVGLGGCTPHAGNDLTQMLNNLQQNLQPVWTMLLAACYVFGVVLMGTGIFKLKQYGQMTVMMSTHAALGPSLAYLMVGAGLLFIPTLLDTLMISLWGTGFGNYDTMPGDPGVGVGYAEILVPIVRIVQVIGFIAFLRGWLHLLP